MKQFDVLVIGSGSGMLIANRALMNGLSVALVESGPLGGTCLNRGCIPSKMVIFPADVIYMIRESTKFGINVSIKSIDFRFVMDRMRRFIEMDRSHMENGIGSVPDLTFYNDIGEFISDYTMSVSGETIKAENIFIVSGSRPNIPPIKNLEKVEYLTSVNVWDINDLPKSMIFIGGGYIAVEFAHFFSSFGSNVTIISRSQNLVKHSEPEISEFLKRTMEKRMNIVTGFEAVKVEESGNLKEVIAVDQKTGDEQSFSAECLFISSGRRSNSDLLKPERTGVELDNRSFVLVNKFLETSKKRIWAFGDAIGKYMFKHVANYEAGIAWHNFSHKGHKIPVNYSSVPYGVFSYPQVASVGMTEKEARERGYKVLVGIQELKETAKGAAMDEEGFVKVIVEEKTGKILGSHIVAPYAPTLIQEIINVMNCGDGSYTPIIQAMHIHPALSEVVQFAFYNLQKPHEH